MSISDLRHYVTWKVYIHRYMPLLHTST